MVNSRQAFIQYEGPKLFLPRPTLLRHTLNFRQKHPSDVDVKVLIDVLAEYGLELMTPPQFPMGKGRSHSLVVHTSEGKKIFKKYKSTVIRPAIVQEHSILAYLAELNFPSPHLVVTQKGETWVGRDKDNYALFDFIEGGFQYHRYILLPGQIKQFIRIAGETLATLHDKLQDFVPEGYNQNGFKSLTEGRWREPEWYLNKLSACVEKTPRLAMNKNKVQLTTLLQRAEYMEKTLLKLEALLQEAPLPRRVIHGDYGPYNLLFRKSAPVVILDFEIARLDWRLTELIDAMWRFCYDRWLGFRFNKIRWLLDAYQIHLPLTQSEWQFLPAMWKYLYIRRCIVQWDHYCHTQVDFRLAKAINHLEFIDWMTAHQDQFVTAVRSTNPQR